MYRAERRKNEATADRKASLIKDAIAEGIASPYSHRKPHHTQVENCKMIFKYTLLWANKAVCTFHRNFSLESSLAIDHVSRCFISSEEPAQARVSYSVIPCPPALGMDLTSPSLFKPTSNRAQISQVLLPLAAASPSRWANSEER